GNDADGRSPSLERNAEHRAILALVLVLARRVLGIGQAVRQMNGLLLESGAASEGAAPRGDRVAGRVFEKIGRSVVGCGYMVLVAFAFEDQGKFCIAESTCCL